MVDTARSATPEEVAVTYLRAWRDGDIGPVRPLLHPDVEFTGALGATRGAEDTLRGLSGMFAMTKQVEVIKRWVDGPDVITWFELTTNSVGPLPVVNWSHIEDGRLTRIRAAFDPRPILG